MSQQEQGEPTRSMPAFEQADSSAPMTARSEAQRPGRTEVPDGGALLTVIGDDLEADYFILTGEEALIGRSPDASVLLDDVTVSRQHAKITKESNGWVINDLRSLNGTYLNRERVEKGRLSDGDELQVGKFRFVFVLPEVTNG